jgi:acyl-coenzyme A synthetase/AMP-(fatty) acid ligase
MLEALIEATRDELTALGAPLYEDMLNKELSEEYPFNITFEEVKHKSFMAVHTSGTSGHPKPIYWNHTGINTLASHSEPQSLSGDIDGLPLLRGLMFGQEIFVPFPFFHVSK